MIFDPTPIFLHIDVSSSFGSPFVALRLSISHDPLLLLQRLPPAETPAEQALVTTFDMLLAKKIVPKAAFASWYQTYKAKHDGAGRPQHPIMQEFFKKRVLT